MSIILLEAIAICWDFRLKVLLPSEPPGKPIPDYGKSYYQFSSVAQSGPTSPMDCSMAGFLSISNSWIESVMPSNHLILCRALLLLPSILPSIKAFPVSQLFASGGQSFGVSASALVLPMNISGLISFRMDWLDLLAVKGLSRVFSNTTVQKHHSSALSFLYSPTLTSVHDYWKNNSFD